MSDAEQALLATVHDGTPPRANQMVRDGRGRVFVGPNGRWIFVLDGAAVHQHQKVAGDVVDPSPSGERFLACAPKKDVQEFMIGTEAPTAVVFAYPGGSGFSSRGGHIWGAAWLDDDRVGVLYSDDKNDCWLILCVRSEQGWVEADNTNLRGYTGLAATGDMLVVDHSKGKSVEIWGVRDDRLHKLAKVDRSKHAGTVRSLPAGSHEAVYLGAINSAAGSRLDGLDGSWATAKLSKPKKDTQVMPNLCAGGFDVAAFDDEVIAQRKAAYEAFAEQDGKVETFVGPSSRGFLARWPKDVLRHVVVDEAGGFAVGPMLIPPGKRFKWWVASAGRAGDLDVVSMSGGTFVVP